MHRRTLLQSFAAVFTVAPFARLRAQSKPPAWTPAELATLQAIADTTLPASLGAAGRSALVKKFVAWHVNFREGAEAGPGYGNPRPRNIGAPPATRYPAQFAALDAAAKAKGGRSLAALNAPDRRFVIEAALETPQRATQLPGQPNGTNLVADVMGFFFNSAAGYDLAYNAAIGRDNCRTLAGSENPPAPLGGK